MGSSPNQNDMKQSLFENVLDDMLGYIFNALNEADLNTEIQMTFHLVCEQSGLAG